jgi:hypothetical protein
LSRKEKEEDRADDADPERGTASAAMIHAKANTGTSRMRSAVAEPRMTPPGSRRIRAPPPPAGS